MPFTFAHPAILLPFRKKLSVTGFVIGCMSPDFEYFLRFKIFSNYSHTFSGIILFCLPISILVSVVFHQIIRNSLIDNAPKYINSRTIKYKSFHWILYLKENKFKVFYSILLGAFSHVLWDSFTHDDGFFVMQFEILKQSISIAQFEIPLLKILQHLSTLFGFIYILYVIHQLPKEISHEHQINYNFYISIVIISFCLLFSLILFNQNSIKIGNLIVAMISCCFLSTLITTLFLSKKNK